MRPIDGDALKERLQSLAYDDWNQGVSTTWAQAYSEVADMIDDFPSADVREVKRGRWVYKPEIGWGETWTCSECGEKTMSTIMGKPRYHWCPMCGADMREEE